jgi:hypothetical protein
MKGFDPPKILSWNKSKETIYRFLTFIRKPHAVEKTSNVSLILRGSYIQPAPGIKRIIYIELVGEIFQIIGETQAETFGDRFDSARDRVGINVLGYVGGMDDPGHPQQPGILEVIFQDDRLERAAPVFVTQLDAWSVKRDGAGFPGDPVDLDLRDEQELGVAVDEAGDQPRAGDAVHVDMGAGDPFHGFFL